MDEKERDETCEGERREGKKVEVKCRREEKKTEKKKEERENKKMKKRESSEKG